MSLYKDTPLIPGQRPPAAEAAIAGPDQSATTEGATTPTADPAQEAPPPGLDQAAPTAATTAAVTAEGATATEPAEAAPTAAPLLSPLLWGNGSWAVTDAGMESRVQAGPHRMLVAYEIPAGELLKCRTDEPGVASWALQLAAKSWVDDPVAMLDAIEQALRVHHPGQTVVDVGLTRQRALAEWARARSGSDTEDLGHDYLAGATDRFARYADGRAQRAATEGAAGCPDWTADYPAQHRDLLRRHGAHPDGHPNARAYNSKLTALAESGLTGDALDDAARALEDALIHEREPEEVEMPPEAEWEIERMIEDEREAALAKRAETEVEK